MAQYSKLDQSEISAFLFHPRSTNKPQSIHDYLDLDFEVDKNISLGCRFFISGKKASTILFFHGNGETVDEYEDIASLYLKAGLNFLVFTYRGYGWSNGTPTATTMISDSGICFEKAKTFLQKNDFSGPLFVMGRSIGSVSAIEVSTQFADSIKGLIIESGFADTLPLLKNIGCVDAEKFISEEEGFGNRDKIETVKLPTLILHGARDAIIPVPQAERLQAFSGARTKKFFVIPGADHNSVMAFGGEHYFTTITSFINDITGESSWRKRRKKYRTEDK